MPTNPTIGFLMPQVPEALVVGTALHSSRSNPLVRVVSRSGDHRGKTVEPPMVGEANPLVIT